MIILVFWGPLRSTKLCSEKKMTNDKTRNVL